MKSLACLEILQNASQNLNTQRFMVAIRWGDYFILRIVIHTPYMDAAALKSWFKYPNSIAFK
ncbi:hypothetical protein BJN41_09740 [Acinetobacter towneri]|uniref:Uncharacterized protein n=1 Tax=Acinetobacter towneri TaxID=202956 RepID=A0A1E8E0T5_9GAMM|nr:hypothetical protein BJN41_09740 [Acinetobacter towneri]